MIRAYIDFIFVYTLLKVLNYLFLFMPYPNFCTVLDSVWVQYCTYSSHTDLFPFMPHYCFQVNMDESDKKYVLCTWYIVE